MDSQFRRIFYNFTTDAMATASITYVSSFILDQSADDVLRLVGTGRDWDRLGTGEQIVNVKWLDDRGAILCEVEPAVLETCEIDRRTKACKYCEDFNDNKICDDQEMDTWTCEKETEIACVEMLPGKHVIRFKVKDNEANWSEYTLAEVMVFEQIGGQVRLPMLSR